MEIDKKLIEYIDSNVFPSYEKNEWGHGIDHIKEVIRRSIKFADTVENIDYNMVYTIAAYHDIGHYINPKLHEKISADMLYADKNLKNFFNDEQIRIMAEAVEDHRSSIDGEPRSIYGKIVSSADRPTVVEKAIKRTYTYTLEHNPEYSLDQIVERSRQHLIDKFCKNGYAREKMYFEDIEYIQFLKDMEKITKDASKFKKEYIKIVGIK